LNVTLLPLCVEPKLFPVIVTCCPTGPDEEDRLVMVGVTVNSSGVLLGPPGGVATTLPVVASDGTATIIVVLPVKSSSQLVGVTVWLLKNVTVPIVPPRNVPSIVTVVPTGPDVGEILVRVGEDWPEAISNGPRHITIKATSCHFHLMISLSPFSA
jgi:hypothetical protein